VEKEVRKVEIEVRKSSTDEQSSTYNPNDTSEALPHLLHSTSSTNFRQPIPQVCSPKAQLLYEKEK
jgi:hypothetical protein